MKQERTKQFINDALEGGWEETFGGQFNKVSGEKRSVESAGLRGQYFYVPVGSILLEVDAWHAVYKTRFKGFKSPFTTISTEKFISDYALARMREFIELLQQGNSIEEALEIII